jgi:hypothetical protein
MWFAKNNFPIHKFVGLTPSLKPISIKKCVFWLGESPFAFQFSDIQNGHKNVKD